MTSVYSFLGDSINVGGGELSAIILLITALKSPCASKLTSANGEHEGKQTGPP